jgi:hypothetical protein
MGLHGGFIRSPVALHNGQWHTTAPRQSGFITARSGPSLYSCTWPQVLDRLAALPLPPLAAAAAARIPGSGLPVCVFLPAAAAGGGGGCAAGGAAAERPAAAYGRLVYKGRGLQTAAVVVSPSAGGAAGGGRAVGAGGGGGMELALSKFVRFAAAAAGAPPAAAAGAAARPKVAICLCATGQVRPGGRPGRLLTEEWQIRPSLR